MFRRILAWIAALADTNAARLETERYRALYEAERRARIQSDEVAAARMFRILDLQQQLHEQRRLESEREIFWRLNGPKLRVLRGGGRDG